MSYRILEDGEIEFTCQGKECGKTVKSRLLRAAPKGWLVSGILRMTDREEDELGTEKPTINQEIMTRLGPYIGGHWCSKKCAQSVLCTDDVIEAVKEAGLCLVLYGKTELVIDGTKRKTDMGLDDEEPPKKGRKGSRDDEGYRGSPPPYTMRDGDNPI